MFSSKMLILCALALFGYASAEVISSGACPAGITVQPNFNVTQYLGLWYEYGKYPTIFEANGKCNTAEYTLRSDGNVGVRNTMIDATTGVESDIVGYATPVENAKLKVVFPVSSSANATSNYWVLETDYNSYSVVYSCQPVSSILHTTYAWILTRERTPPAATITKAENALVRNCVSLDPLVITVQTGCTAAGC